MQYTIHNYWRPLLGSAQSTPSKEVAGWLTGLKRLPTFIEAPLAPNTELAVGQDPYKSNIVLVSAPGAVGKSTLAREISAITGAVYLDLAIAEPVGGNTISGGLAKSGLFNEWAEQKTTILIDGLDEARLRVTQEAFEAFLKDIASLCLSRDLPVIMFGRTGAVQEAWIILESLVSVSVLEIGYYDSAQAIEFAFAQLKNTREGSRHEDTERNAIAVLLRKLRDETQGDGGTFSGYAPVLQAIAERVAKDSNPSALIASVEKGEKPVTLQTVANAILERERSKLRNITFDDPTLLEKLYSPEEQLKRLVARVFNTPQPSAITMTPGDARRYDDALSTWLPEHPFLDGRGKPSSSVFEAMIVVTALQQRETARIAVDSQLAKSAAANPFLADFYYDAVKEKPAPNLPPEHIGVVYSSIRARLAIGDTATLVIEDDEYATEEDALNAEIEISITKRGMNRSQSIHFTTTQVGVFHLGSYIEDVSMSVPLSAVNIGTGSEVILTAPIDIECSKIIINATKLIVEASLVQTPNSVSLIATDCQSNVTSVPAVRGQTALSVSWPGARSHPWTNFASEPRIPHDERAAEALRRLRKFVIAFRSHSKGSLARFKDKLDHQRMTKGAGQAVLNLMIKRGIITTDGTMYYLDPDKLGLETGATYADCVAKRFQEKTIEFVEQALSGS